MTLLADEVAAGPAPTLPLPLSSRTCSNPTPTPEQPDLLVLSPGPGSPKDFDLSRTIDIALRRKLPIIGVCLGLQARSPGVTSKCSRSKHTELVSIPS